MQSIEVKDFKKFCDEIRYEIQDGKLIFVEFLSKGIPVMEEFKKFLIGLDVNQIKEKVPFMTLNPAVTMILKNFSTHVSESQKKINIKNAILNLKNSQK
ncbi:MAG: hypothetical protein LKG27_05485 [Clostridiaceae bacterium]|jgi:hypothetical protein|nr:hypothetical protein [Clostridiaceae bacterium]